MQTQEINMGLATKVLTTLLGTERTQFIYAMYDLLEQTAREARQEAEMRAVALYDQGVADGKRVASTDLSGVFGDGYEQGYDDGMSDGYDMAQQAFYSEEAPLIEWPFVDEEDDLRAAVAALNAAYEGDSGDETDGR